MALVSKLIWAYCRDCRNGRGPRGDGAGDRVLDGTIHLVTLFPLARRWCAAPFGSRPGFHCSMGMPLAVMRSRVTHVDARYPRVFWFSLSGGTLLGKDVGFFLFRTDGGTRIRLGHAPTNMRISREFRIMEVDESRHKRARSALLSAQLWVGPTGAHNGGEWKHQSGKRFTRWAG